MVGPEAESEGENMQALKRIWTDELQSHFQHLSTRSAEPAPVASEPGPAESAPVAPELGTPAAAEAPAPDQAPAEQAVADENVLRPTIFQREAPGVALARQRPELSAAIKAVTRATELMKEAELRADQKTQRAADLAFRTLAQLERAEAQIEAAQNAIRDLDEQAKVAARRAAEQLKAAEAQTTAARERISQLEAEIGTLTGLLTESGALMQESEKRVFAAETRAMEAREDIKYLESQIREHFGLPTA